VNFHKSKIGKCHGFGGETANVCMYFEFTIDGNTLCVFRDFGGRKLQKKVDMETSVG